MRRGCWRTVFRPVVAGTCSPGASTPAGLASVDGVALTSAVGAFSTSLVGTTAKGGGPDTGAAMSGFDGLDAGAAISGFDAAPEPQWFSASYDVPRHDLGFSPFAISRVAPSKSLISRASVA